MRKSESDLIDILNKWHESGRPLSKSIFTVWLSNQPDQFIIKRTKREYVLQSGQRFFDNWSANIRSSRTAKPTPHVTPQVTPHVHDSRTSKYNEHTAVKHNNGTVYNKTGGNVIDPSKTPQVTPQVTPQEQVIADRRIRVLTSERDEAKKKYSVLLEQVDLIEKRYDALCAIKEPISYQPILPNYKESTAESIAVAQLSDLHVGEKVDPETVNGLNEFNPDICDKRVYNYFQNLLRLIESGRRDAKIETLFLSLTGDNITGFIHEELMQTNYMSPTEEVRFAKRLIIRGIDFLLNHGKFKRIFVQTNFGNHGRNTKRTGYGAAYKNSYDYMLYCDISDYYRNNDILEFNISKSHICYSPPLFGKVIRTFHGDTFNYAGGIGGLTVPLIKYIHRLDLQGHADMNLIGHYHQFFKPLNNCVVNGSIIGINSYAQGIGCSPEPAQQSLMFLDKHRGFTSLHPVFCD